MSDSVAAPRTRHPAQLAAMVIGVVLVLVGILGFIPGITTNSEQLSFAGYTSGALLFGVFAVSVLHNLVHFAFGVAGLTMARTFAGARSFLLGGGIIFAVLWLYGLFIDRDSAANFIPVNTADNWLHLVLAIAMIALGVLFIRERRAHA